MAGFIRVFAGLVARHMLQHPQRHRLFLAAQGGQGIQRQTPAGGFCSKKKQPIQLLLGEGLELRKQGAEGFTNAGGGLSHQAVTVTGGAVNLISQLALASAKLRMRKTQAREGLIALAAMLALVLGPANIAAALQLEKLTQLIRADGQGEGGFVLGNNVEVDYRQIDLWHVALLAEQPAVDLGLGPVQQAMIFRDAADITPVGLDLLQQVFIRVVTVRAAAYLQALVCAT